MHFSVWVMGELKFPRNAKGAIDAWRKLPLDYASLPGWPEEGFFSTEGEPEAKTVGDVLDRIAGLSAAASSRPIAPPLGVTEKGSTIAISGFLDKQQFLDLHRDLGAAIRRAADVGATGAMVLAEEIGDFGYRFRLNKGKSTFEEIEPAELSALLEAGVGPVRQAQPAAPALANEAKSVDLLAGLTPAAVAIHGRISDALRRMSHEAIAEAARRAGDALTLFVKPSGTMTLAALGSGEVIRDALIRGISSLNLDGELPRTELLATALGLLANVDLDAAEPIARDAAMSADVPPSVRYAGLRALGRSSSEQSVETLAKALREHVGAPWAIDQSIAAAALGASPAASAGDRLAALVPDDVAELSRAADPRRFTLVELVIKALGARRHAPSAERLAAIWRDAKEDALRTAAGEAILSIGTPSDVEAIAATLSEAAPAQAMLPVRATLMLGAPRPFDRLAPFFDEASLATRDGDEIAKTVLEALRQQAAAKRAAGDRQRTWLDADPRWIDLLLGLLPREGIGWNALRLLPFAADPRVLPALLGRLGKDELDDVLEALHVLRDPAAIPELERRLAKTKKKGEAAKLKELVEFLRAR